LSIDDCRLPTGSIDSSAIQHSALASGNRQSEINNRKVRATLAAAEFRTAVLQSKISNRP
jgi:hypothetical protein